MGDKIGFDLDCIGIPDKDDICDKLKSVLGYKFRSRYVGTGDAEFRVDDRNYISLGDELIIWAFVSGYLHGCGMEYEFRWV